MEASKKHNPEIEQEIFTLLCLEKRAKQFCFKMLNELKIRLIYLAIAFPDLHSKVKNIMPEYLPVAASEFRQFD